jgi:hypothetical protein
MPWVPKDARRHTRKAKTPAQRDRWAAIANAILHKTGDEGLAIRIANSHVGSSAKGRPRERSQ